LALLQQKRELSYSAVRAAVISAIQEQQQAPDPKAYLASGVVKPKTEVNVKKVLVIGSGGLAIGQAGEFDYSGWLKVKRREMMMTTTTTTRTTKTNAVLISNPMLVLRLAGSQSSQRGWRRVRPHQPQHCHDPDEPYACGRGLLPARHARVRLVRD
jgi:hypothetical protein